MLTGASDQPEAVQSWHLTIRYDQVGHFLLDHFPTFLAITRDPHVVARSLQLEFRGTENVNLVVTQENSFTHGSNSLLKETTANPSLI